MSQSAYKSNTTVGTFISDLLPCSKFLRCLIGLGIISEDQSDSMFLGFGGMAYIGRQHIVNINSVLVSILAVITTMSL